MEGQLQLSQGGHTSPPSSSSPPPSTFTPNSFFSIFFFLSTSFSLPPLPLSLPLPPQVRLHFTRDKGFYYTTVFAPGLVLVMSSFFTFWIEWDATPAR